MVWGKPVLTAEDEAGTLRARHVGSNPEAGEGRAAVPGDWG